MKQGMLATLFVAVLALGFGMTQAPAAASPPASETVVAPDALQGGSCGDYQCQPPEDCRSCPQDCGDCCGNRRCEPPEDCNSCPQDCRC